MIKPIGGELPRAIQHGHGSASCNLVRALPTLALLAVVCPSIVAAQAPAHSLAVSWQNPTLAQGAPLPGPELLEQGSSHDAVATDRSYGSTVRRGALMGGGIGLAVGLVGFAAAANNNAIFDPVMLVVGMTALGVVTGASLATLGYILR